jgi:peptide/nickel transport system substrate-binding protein
LQRTRIVILIAVVAVVAAGCTGGGKPGPQKSGQSQQVVEGGTLRLGTTSTIDSLNPFVGFQANSFLVWQSIWPYLGTFDNHNKIVPNWATSWDASTDGLTYTFRLPSGTKWSDGQPMTASDAAFTFNTIIKYQSGPTGNWASNVSNMKNVDAPNPTTVVFHFAKPAADAVSQIIGTPILPEHVWGKYATGDGKDLRSAANAAVTPTDGHPVVSGGPFMLVEYKKDFALMQRNPDYTLTAKPYIDGFGIQIYGSEDPMITAFKNGDLDAIEGVPTTTVQSLKTAGFTINDTPGVFFYDFIINSNPKKPEHRELLDPKVKEAFEYAIDRQQIIRVALGGYGTPGASIVPPASGSWSDPNVKPLPFDIDQANQILDSLGFQKGSGGIRIADGHPMDYTVIVPSSQQAVLSRTFQIIQPDFQQIGVKLSLKVLDPSAAFDAIGAPNYKYLDFDLAMWDWIPTPPHPSYILSVVMCNQYGSNSDSGYCNPTYDKLWHQQASTIDQTKRRQIVYQMQEILFQDRPYIVLNYPDVIDAYNSDHWAGFYNEAGFGIFINNSTFTMNFVHQT